MVKSMSKKEAKQLEAFTSFMDMMERNVPKRPPSAAAPGRPMLRPPTTIDDRVEGIRRKSLRFPQGQRHPPHLSPLLPDRMFPPLRDTPGPIHPLFPPPGNFPTDLSRYAGLDRIYELIEVRQMANTTPTYLADAQGDKRFFCANGEVFANLRQLHVGLLTMRDEHFRNHVNDGKNDFARWIADVLSDSALAGDLGRVRSRALTAYKVGQRMKQVRLRGKV